MEFRTIPPDPAEFPKLQLLWPPALPATLLLGAWLAEINGHVWNIHAEGALLLGAFFVLLIVGTVFSFLSLRALLPALRQHPSLRTKANLVCTGVSLVFVILSVVYGVSGLLELFIR
ncbi:hypothetical protein [Piscinibacter sp.]|uniref:hypothetical protein n=1 Tax=Piscinibacter sp. TaxID=1903157 RepID=UPI0039E5D2FD